MLVAFVLLCFSFSAAFAQKAVSKSAGPPAFFLQDPTDGLCLAGKGYKRCSIDTLWYVTGKPGSYQIHHRLVDENDDESCLDRAQCHLEESDVKLSNCNHCGAKRWNIRGEAQTGNILLRTCSTKYVSNIHYFTAWRSTRLRLDRRWE